MSRLRLAFLVSLLVLAALGRASLVAQNVDYAAKDGTALRGYLAYDSAKQGWRTVVLVFHDWDGIDDYERGRCRQLAALGYVAFAPDIYGKDAKVETVEEKSALTQKFYNDPDLFRQRAQDGLAQAIKVKNVDPNRVVAIGYCFGGGSALELARSGVSLRGVVTFHGTLGTQKPMAKNFFHGKVLVLTGGSDPIVPASQVDAFQAEMKNANVPVQVIVYPDAGHAFTEKGSEKLGMKGVGYNAKADAESWKELVKFLKETLG